MILSEFFLDGALRGPPVQCSVYYYEWRLATTNEGGTNVAIYARENFENCWKQYHSLGVNGVMDDLHSKFLKLPVSPPDES